MVPAGRRNAALHPSKTLTVGGAENPSALVTATSAPVAATPANRERRDRFGMGAASPEVADAGNYRSMQCQDYSAAQFRPGVPVPTVEA
jgi:hypothetical protein